MVDKAPVTVRDGSRWANLPTLVVVKRASEEKVTLDISVEDATRLYAMGELDNISGWTYATRREAQAALISNTAPKRKWDDANAEAAVSLPSGGFDEIAGAVA